MNYPELSGRRVLVVEDELMVALLVEDMLIRAGCIVVGPFARVAEALAAASTEAIDVALLDIHLAGEKVFPVAHALERRVIPFLFVTGYGQSALPRDRPDWEACAKPFQPNEVLRRLIRKMQSG